MDEQIKIYKYDMWITLFLILLGFVYLFRVSIQKTNEISVYKKYLIEKGYAYRTNDIRGQSILILK